MPVKNIRVLNVPIPLFFGWPPGGGSMPASRLSLRPDSPTVSRFGFTLSAVNSRVVARNPTADRAASAPSLFFDFIQ